MYKNFLFDLDGTLLPMDMKYFIELYVAAFCKCLAPVTKIESKPLMDSIWASVAQMARNDGDCGFLAHDELTLQARYARFQR